MKNFALIGAAGYIAPRHMKAIRDVGGDLKCAYDPNDSVGVIDSHFPQSSFFVEFERFDRHISKMTRGSDKIDYVSICSPNYLHDSHIRFGLRSDADVICEKPLVLNPWNIDAIQDIECETGRKAYTVLQLRLHPSIVKLQRQITDIGARGEKYDVELTYITSRGKWYLYSWKGDERKSGGIATNIGVHFFDMLHHLFGSLQRNEVHLSSPLAAGGILEYERARVRWFLSIDARSLPQTARDAGRSTYRSIMMDGQEIEFSDGFTELHTESYKRVIAGTGFGVGESRVAIETVAAIRTTPPRHSPDEHPFVAAARGRCE